MEKIIDELTDDVSHLLRVIDYRSQEAAKSVMALARLKLIIRAFEIESTQEEMAVDAVDAVINAIAAVDKRSEENSHHWREKAALDLQAAVEAVRAQAITPRPKPLVKHGLDNTWVRQTVWEMTGGICAYCGCDVVRDEPGNTTKTFCVEHVVPVSAGGPDHIANYVPSCFSCNAAKKAKPLFQFIKDNVERRQIKVAAELALLEGVTPISAASEVA